MENPDVPQLTFHCPSCDVKLSVDLASAGVSGPCPRCQAIIHSPSPPLAALPAMPVAKATEVAANEVPSPPVVPAATTPAPGGSSWLPLVPIGIGTIALGAAAALVWWKKDDLFARHHDAGNSLAVVKEHSNSKEPAQDIPAPRPEPAVTAPAAVPPAKLQPAVAPTPVPEIFPAEKVLERFLTATTFEERSPWMIQDISAQSNSQGALPYPVSVKTAWQVRNEKLGTIDRFFTAEFAQHGEHCILVRGKESENPKVFAASVIDLLGGRLAAFASDAKAEPASFHVFASALPLCGNPSVPSPADKITVRLMSSDAGKPIATAYAAKTSAIGKLLESAAAEIRYGQPVACVVGLRWNHTEDPKHPFLEVIDLKDFGWTP